MDRKDFLRSISSIAIGTGVLPLATLLGSCGAAAPVLRAASRDKKIELSLNALPDLATLHSYAKVYVDQMSNPIILFRRVDGTLYAVLSTCAHSGCEVKKLRTKFECPCHRSEYDLDGNVLKGPAPEPLDTFAVREFADRIQISME